MHARVTRLEGTPDKIEDGIAMINDQVIPTAKGLNGFVGAYFLADRATGKMLGITLWDSEEHLRQSEEAAQQLRQTAAQQSGGTVQSVERYEVVAQV